MNKTLIDKINYWILIVILFFMPYSTFVLQLKKHYFETIFHRAMPNVLNYMITGWKEEFLILGLFLALIQIIITKKWLFKITKLDITLLAVAIVLALYGFVLNPNIKALIFAIRYDFVVFGFYWLARTVNINRERWINIIKKLIWFTLPVMVLGIFQALIMPREFLTRFGYSWESSATGNPLPPYHLIGENLVRAFSTTPGPNSLAMYCGFLLLVLVYLRREILKSWQTALLATFIGLTFILTYSRSHLFSVVGAIILVWILKLVFYRNNKKQDVQKSPKSLVKISIVMTMFLLMLFAFVTYLPKLSRSFSNVSNGVIKEYLVRANSTNLHDLVRDEAWVNLEAQPYGYGVSSAGLAMTNLGGTVFNPESSFIIFMYEYGVLGLLGLLTIIYMVIWTILNIFSDFSDDSDKRNTRFIMAGFFAIVIGTFFLPCWYEIAPITWWILFGLFVNDYLQSFRNSRIA